MPNFKVRAAWLRDCGVARLLGCVAAVLRGCCACVAARLLQNMIAVFSYVEYKILHSKYGTTTLERENAWLLGCATAGLRGCGVA